MAEPRPMFDEKGHRPVQPRPFLGPAVVATLEYLGARAGGCTESCADGDHTASWPCAYSIVEVPLYRLCWWERLVGWLASWRS